MSALSVTTIVEHVAFETGQRVDAITGASQREWEVTARAAVVWLALRRTRLTQAEVGAALGRCRDTVGNAYARANALLRDDPYFPRLIDTVWGALDALRRDAADA